MTTLGLARKAGPESWPMGRWAREVSSRWPNQCVVTLKEDHTENHGKTSGLWDLYTLVLLRDPGNRGIDYWDWGVG